VAAVELERLDAEFAAQVQVEGGRRLHPLAFQPELCEAVIHEEVRAAHVCGEARCGEMVLHVGEAHARGDADDARAGGEQRGLADAEAFAGFQAPAAPVRRILREIEERVVADGIAHRVIQ